MALHEKTLAQSPGPTQQDHLPYWPQNEGLYRVINRGTLCHVKGVFTDDETFGRTRTFNQVGPTFRPLDGHGSEVVQVQLSAEECNRIHAASGSPDSARKAIAYLQGDGAAYRGITAPAAKVEYLRAVITKLPATPITSETQCPVPFPPVEWKVQPSALWAHLVARMVAAPKAKATPKAKAAPTASTARIDALEAQLAELIRALQGSQNA